MDVSLGSDTLDDLLGGGVPERRNVLVTGPPGTGKTTLAMQFLQDGLDDGESCMLISTEQTLRELKDTLEPYPFDLEDDRLTVVTVHAQPAPTIKEDEDLVVKTLEPSGETVTEWFELPFNRTNVCEYLTDYAPQDRIALDSVSGVRPIAEDRVSFWRSTYDLLRLFADQFEATSLLTAQDETERAVASALIEYATHGVLALEWADVDGQRQRFVRVEKMRGRDHDDRRHRLVLGDSGVDASPGRRTPPSHVFGGDRRSTGIRSLDDLLGGGFVPGGLTTLTHDGTTGYYTINASAMATALDDGMRVAIAPPAEIDLDQLDRYWRHTDWTVDQLLDEGRLIVMEMVGDSHRDHENVVVYDEQDQDWFRMMDRVYQRGRDRPLFALIDTEPLLQRVSPARVREVRYRAATNYIGEKDTIVYTINPLVQPNSLVEFLVDTSTQAVDVHRDDDGLEWLSLRKSPGGEPGTTKLVSYVDEPPFVELV